MPAPPIYGQVVAGPPGSGKTTYCTGMQDYLRLLGRDAWVINLDPANEVPKRPIVDPNQTNTANEEGNANGDDDNKNNILPYETMLDICDSVVNLSSVMKQLGLGPNGGLVYCMEYLEAHVEEVVEMIRERVTEGAYLIFDLPGQVELYTHGTAVPRLLQQLVKVLDLRLVAIQLVDAHYCTEPANFLSAALLGTTTMLRLELPTVSVLSKIDLLANYGPLPFSLEYFTECQDLDRLIPFLRGGAGGEDFRDDDDYFYNDDNQNNNYGPSGASADGLYDYADDPDYQKAKQRTRSSPFFKKHEKLHRVLAETVEDFGLLSFLPLDISSAESVGRVLARIDKCNGYVFLDQKTSKAQDIFQCAVQSEPSNYETIADIQERLSAAHENQRQQHHQQQAQQSNSASFR